MTRKHFKAIAGIIRRAKISKRANTDTLATRDFITDELADYFGSENPNFSKGKFLDAFCR